MITRLDNLLQYNAVYIWNAAMRVWKCDIHESYVAVWFHPSHTFLM